MIPWMFEFLFDIFAWLNAFNYICNSCFVWVEIIILYNVLNCVMHYIA